MYRGDESPALISVDIIRISLCSFKMYRFKSGGLISLVCPKNKTSKILRGGGGGFLPSDYIGDVTDVQSTSGGVVGHQAHVLWVRL